MARLLCKAFLKEMVQKCNSELLENKTWNSTTSEY